MSFISGILAYLVIFIRVTYGLLSQVVITGGTGALGSSIIEGLCSKGQHKVIASYRDAHKAQDALNKLRQLGLHSLPQFFELDLGVFHDKSQLPLLGNCNAHSDINLINNAAACLPGGTLDSLKRSLSVNTIYPILFAKQMIKVALQHPEKQIRVIHVSSGDGELVFLNSQIASRVSTISSLDGLLEYCSVLQNNFSPSMEYAFGSTPMYSLSKCLLTHSAPLLQAMAPSNFKIVSWCPGDFSSPMSSEDECERAVDVRETFPYLWDMLTDPIQGGKYEGGKLYRKGAEIPF